MSACSKMCRENIPLYCLGEELAEAKTLSADNTVLTAPSLTSVPYSPVVFQQVVCLSIDGLGRSFGVAMRVTANWWVEYSGHINPPSPHGAAESIFSFTDRRIISITPITEVQNHYVYDPSDTLSSL